MKKFIELDHHNKVDHEIKSLLETLKQDKIPKALPKSNIFKFDVKWSTESGISLSTHSDYIEKFGETFYEQVKLLIDRNQKEKNYFENLSSEDAELLQEVLDHAYFCVKTAEKFKGRNDILDQVKFIIL